MNIWLEKVSYIFDKVYTNHYLRISFVGQSLAAFVRLQQSPLVAMEMDNTQLEIEIHSRAYNIHINARDEEETYQSKGQR